MGWIYKEQVKVLINFKHLILGISGFISFEVGAELIPSNLLKQSGSGANLAHGAIEANSKKSNNFSGSSNTQLSQNGSMIDRLNALASATVRNFTQNGVASWYGRQFHGRKTANGEVFNMNDLTAAHKSLPLNCKIRVTNKENGKSVIVRVNDRGPFHGNRVVDLSYGAAKVLGIVNTGTANVLIERIPN